MLQLDFHDHQRKEQPLTKLLKSNRLSKTLKHPFQVQHQIIHLQQKSNDLKSI